MDRRELLRFVGLAPLAALLKPSELERSEIELVTVYPSQYILRPDLLHPGDYVKYNEHGLLERCEGEDPERVGFVMSPPEGDRVTILDTRGAHESPRPAQAFRARGTGFVIPWRSQYSTRG